MTDLTSSLRRLATARRYDARMSAFWSYFGSFGDDFFTEDDDSFPELESSQHN